MSAIKIYNGTSWVELAKKSDIKKLWLHTVMFEVASHVMKYEYYSTSNANISLADLCDRISNMVFGDIYGGVFVCKSTFSGTYVEYTYYGTDGTFVYISSDRVYIEGQTATEV